MTIAFALGGWTVGGRSGRARTFSSLKRLLGGSPLEPDMLGGLLLSWLVLLWGRWSCIHGDRRGSHLEAVLCFFTASSWKREVEKRLPSLRLLRTLGVLTRTVAFSRSLARTFRAAAAALLIADSKEARAPCLRNLPIVSR